MSASLPTRALWVVAALAVPLCAATASAWTALGVADDPLVRLPGTQPADGVVLEGPGQCMNCHDNYDPNVDVGFHWRGSMMAQALRDPLFWASVTVAAQDSIWAVGRPNAADLCLRCHTPEGWLGGRSDPSNGSGFTGSDHDGVSCAGCHKLYDPFFEDTYTGVREGSDWVGYWDESGASSTPSAAAALTTWTADGIEASTVEFFNGNGFYDGSNQPVSPGWTDHGGGQYFASSTAERRASFADANANHGQLYSRHHKSRYFCASCHDVSNAVLANLAFDGTTPNDGTTVLPTESQPAYSYGHIERTFSEFMLSDYGSGPGAAGRGVFDPI
ncbi:MAG: hypothetical protein DRI90_19610 [Deltaproteobacteria bacterium]|nr:MAG: hypothetical protein DRI90_19610 [Deltaproteobacteria bacterium]